MSQPQPDAPADPASGRRRHAHPRRHADPRRRAWLQPPRRRAVGLVLTAVLALLGWGAWLTTDALRARTALAGVAVGVQDLRAQVAAGDRVAATATLASLQRHAATARASSDGPHWSAAGAVPVVGPTVRAVSTVGRVADGLAADALPALMDAAALADPTALAPVDGRVPLEPLTAATPAVLAADAAVGRAVAALGALHGAGPVVPVVADGLDRLEAELTAVAATTSTAARAVRLLPSMLGAQGPRHYLVLVQNNAELRATGGIPGSVLLVRAEHGAVEVLEQRAGGSLGDLAAPAVPLTAEEQAIFGEDLAADLRDVTFTPHFPRTGEIARAIWHQGVGDDVDGVLSLDPGALAHVLGATGPVALPDGRQLTAENAVRTLLNDVYLELTDPADQDRFFGTTADAVFDAVVSGRGSAAATVAALARSAHEGRLMVWSAHPEEQALLAGTAVSGELSGARGSAPVLGVYFNDTIAAKMGYYLRSDVRAVPTGCTADGAPTFTVTVDLASTAPADAAGLPTYVTGVQSDVPRGDLQTNVLVYAPLGGRVETVRVDGEEAGVFAQTHDGLRVVGRTVGLRPGQSTRLTLDVVAGRGQTGGLVLRTTPVTSGDASAAAGPDCS